MKKNIKKEIFYPSAPDAVWTALTEPEEISAWLMRTTDFKAEKGRKFTMQAKPMGSWDGKIYGEILSVDRPNSLSYTWKGDQMKSTTIITWTLLPENGGTRVVIEHKGFEGFGDYILGVFHAIGWGRFLKQLGQRL